MRPNDIVMVVIALAVMAYLVSGMVNTWYPHETAQEVEAQYRQQGQEAKEWPQDK